MCFQGVQILQQGPASEGCGMPPRHPFSDASFLPPPDPAARKAPPELSAAEKARLNKFAKILIMSDNRKASAVVDYVKTILERELIPPPDPAPDDQNCAFRAVLSQMPNHEYFFNTETGEAYEAIDLRHQFVSFCVENAEEMFAKLKVTLDNPFKEWLLLQLDPQQESDHSTILALRHMLKVSFISDNFNFSADLGTEDWTNIGKDSDVFTEDWRNC